MRGRKQNIAMLTKSEKDALFQMKKVEAEVFLMRALHKKQGFAQYFNEYLSKFQSAEQSFCYVNNLYESLYGFPKYQTYTEFLKDHEPATIAPAVFPVSDLRSMELFLKKRICDMLQEFHDAGYTSRQLFANAVLAFYPHFDYELLALMYDFQTLGACTTPSVEGLALVEKCARALRLLTQKPVQ